MDRSRGDDGSVFNSMWIWGLVGDDVVACGDLCYSSADEKKPANWYTGSVRVPLSSPAAFQELLAFDLDDHTVLGCRLAMPLIAALDDRVYLLEFADVPRILVSSPQQPKPPALAALPELSASKPTLPTGPAAKDVPFVLRTLEESTMPAGLFGWEGQLFLLSRSPAADRSGTVWWLTRIDPQNDRVVGTSRIASGAPIS